MINRKTCDDIMKNTKHIFKHANALPSSMSDNIYHAPLSLGGINALDLHIYNFSSSIKWFFYNLSEQRETSTMLNIMIGQHSLEMGTNKNIFDVDKNGFF